MALYLGSNKVKLNLSGVVYNLNVLSETQGTSPGRPAPHDDELYSTTKESE